ncbi:uncharacterized protein LOC100893740 isoform X2 [Strongylocentrotus purpuratus]|uniref:RING-type E3 ubiquitin transferase n=1 Tax=Strongylocentrotus purpuratus TaxID=7668 RepID=A0A7M7SZY1_STRPU|nr:uncharacterized protein LOC100893740 isoform X2 [Strongylocentrotus purpuratus]
MSSSDSTRGKSASEKEDKAEASGCMPVCLGCCSAAIQDKMPKSRKRKRSRGRHHSSSSQSSSERLGLGGRRRFIAIARNAPSSAQEMATVLASELRPEHKLPKKEIWVTPRPQFLKLLRSVGANGNTFTAKEVLSYLIKYISSRQLYDPNDPKNVFCHSDPLGQVFNVHSFTIKDAKRLLFENMKVLDKPPELPTIPRMQSMPATMKDCYITFRNNQEHDHEIAPAPPYHPLPHLYTQPTPRSAFQSGVKVMSSGVDVADGIGKGVFDHQVMETMLDTVSEGREGGTDEPDVGISVTPPPKTHPPSSDNCHGGSLSESSQSLGLLGNTQFPRRKKHPKRRHQKLVMDRKSRSRSESSSLTLASKASQRSSSKRSSQKSSLKRSSGRGDVADGRSLEDRPWYCVYYDAGEDVKSQSSEIYSVQGKETAVVTDTSDDLWFMDDERFSVEYEVEDSESELESNDALSDSTTTEAEIFVEVDDLGSSSDSRFADEDTTDSEIPEEDKWKCAECSQVNNPMHGYCSFCWARRSGWLADEDRKNPTERLGDKHVLRRAFSAPAGCRLDNINQASIPGVVSSPADHAPCASDEAGTGHQTARPHRFYSPPQDFADGGKSDGEEDQHQSNVQEERHVFCQISSPGLTSSLRPVQGIWSQDVKVPTTYLTTVHEASEEAIPADLHRHTPAACTTLMGGAIQGNEDQGVGSDVSQNTPGVSDTVSHHSSDSSGDVAGCTPRKRRALLVTREDSGVCLKRQSSGHSGMDEARPVIKGIVPVTNYLVQATPTITPTGCGHEKMISQVPCQTSSSGSSSLAGAPMATHSVCRTPVMSLLTEKTLVGPHQSTSLSSALHQSTTLSSPLHQSTSLSLPLHQSTSLSSPLHQSTSLSSPLHQSTSLSLPLHQSTSLSSPLPQALRTKSNISPLDGIGSGSSMGSGAVASHAQELCRFCCVRPKTACIIHGRTGHQVCCYKCAKKLRRRGKPCPVCRRPIQHIVKNFYA